MSKRCLAIHDLSCLGRCSLTVALPVISAMKIECSALPTCVLSTHTGGFSGYTFRDLTDDIIPICNHLNSLNTNMDAIYTGYLGEAQIEVVSKAIDILKQKNTLIFIDPVMADNGKLYPGFTKSYVSKMREYVKKADVIMPNITEAALICDKEYKEEYDKEYIENLLYDLYTMSDAKVILTGVKFSDEEIGAAIIDDGVIKYYFSKLVPQMFHGTGDLFASVFVGATLNNKSTYDSAALACDFVYESILETRKESKESKYGVDFEPILYKLAEKLN